MFDRGMGEKTGTGFISLTNIPLTRIPNAPEGIHHSGS
jgi:hypothetical protein